MDKAKIEAETPLDGKFLISTSDDGFPVEDVLLGYKQLAEIECVFRNTNHVIDIWSVYHRLGGRIKAHVLFCWLALLLISVVGTDTQQTWHLTTAKWEFDRCASG